MTMPRKYWIIAIAIPLLLAAADGAYWRIVTERLRTGFQNWRAGQAAGGWIAQTGPLSAGGWPTTAVLIVPNLTLHHTGPRAPGDVDIASAAVTLSVSLLDPSTFRLSLTGPVHVRTAGVPDLIVTSDEASLLMSLLQNGPVSASFHASGLRLEAATGAWHATAGLLNANAGIAAGTRSGDSNPAAIFSVAAEAIALPASIKWPLGANLSSVSMDGRLNGELSRTGTIAQAAAAWRDGGGSMEITHFAMGWGPLGLTGSATLALDDQLQPMGSGNARIAGYADTLDRLAAAGMLTKSVATAAKAILSLMAGTSDSDEASSVDVPLTLQYRTLSMRQVPLVRFPELDWPSP